MAKTQEAKQKTGRPVGAKTADRVSIAFVPPACPTCGSTEREPYRRGPAKVLEYAGFINGVAYNRVVWHDTNCKGCGQFLRIREYLNVPDSQK
jgi:hypothetical protein